ALAQIDFLVGDVRGNVARVIETSREAAVQGADLVVFPELSLSGYPPEDLLLHRRLRRQVEEGRGEGCTGVGDAAVLVGLPEYSGAQIYNSMALVMRGTVQAMHRKSELPNYQVFDEKRYFKAGAQPTVVEVGGVKVGILICEDI